jgi:NADH-quinone oxidoreductase subunit N
MQIGAFVLISTIERDSEKYMEISDYQGLSKKYPIHAALLAIFMFSLAGMPPFAGFIGKYYLFSAAVKADYVWLMIIAVISSIISMYYYIGLIIQAYLKNLRKL